MNTIKYEVRSCHDYFVIVCITTGTIICGFARRGDAVRMLNRYYV